MEEQQYPEEQAEGLPPVLENGVPYQQEFSNPSIREMKYLLGTEIPKEYRPEFNRYLVLIDRNIALANIDRGEINDYVLKFSLALDYYKVGQPYQARKEMAELMFKLRLTRSVKGFQAKLIRTSRHEHEFTGLRGNRPTQGESRSRFKFWSKNKGGSEE